MSDYDQPNEPYPINAELKYRMMRLDMEVNDRLTEAKEKSLEARRHQLPKWPRWKWWWE